MEGSYTGLNRIASQSAGEIDALVRSFRTCRFVRMTLWWAPDEHFGHAKLQPQSGL